MRTTPQRLTAGAAVPAPHRHARGYRGPPSRRLRPVRASGSEDATTPPASESAMEAPSSPPPRRRSPAVVSRLPPDEPQERDLFVPIITVLSLAAYGVTALIAWLEYQQ